MTHQGTHVEPIEQLVARLERLWLEPAGADLGQLAAMLEQRQELLTRIQNSDASGLAPESRAELVERIRRVRERDAKLLAALQTRQEQAQKELDQLLHARTAARGYRANDSGPPRGGGRIV